MPRMPSAFLVLALCAAVAGSSPSAELSSALASAHALRSAGAFADAIAAYRAAASQFPARAEPLFFLGLSSRAAGDEEAALEAYRAAVRMDADFAEAHMNLASLLSAREDDPQQALTHYKRALALREWPAATAAHAEFNAALALQALGGRDNVEAALSAVRRVRKLNPTFTPAAELLDELETAAAAEATGAKGPGAAARDEVPSNDAADQCDANAAALHAAAESLQREARRALADTEWPGAARRLGGEHGDGRSEARLLASVVADLSTLLGRVLDAAEPLPV